MSLLGSRCSGASCPCKGCKAQRKPGEWSPMEVYEHGEAMAKRARARCKRLKHHLDPNHVEQWDANRRPAGYCLESLATVEREARR